MASGPTAINTVIVAMANRLILKLDRQKGINKIGIIATDSQGRKLIAMQIISNGRINTRTDPWLRSAESNAAYPKINKLNINPSRVICDPNTKAE